MNTNPNDRPGCIAGTDILKPILSDVLLYAEASGISEELAEKFYWYYEAMGWLIGSSPIRYWQPKLHQWKVSNRVFDKKDKEREEARAKAQGAAKQNGDVFHNGFWWNDYQWYLKEVAENRTKAQAIVSTKHEGKAYFRYP